MPPISVLKISKVVERQTEVVGEFQNDQEAENFIEAAKLEAGEQAAGEDYEYVVEHPLPKAT